MASKAVLSGQKWLYRIMRQGAGRLLKFSGKNPVVLELERIFEAKFTTRSLHWRHQTRLFLLLGFVAMDSLRAALGKV